MRTLLAPSGPIEVTQDLLWMQGHLSNLVRNQAKASLAVHVVDAPRYGKDAAVVAMGEFGGNRRTAFNGGFHNEYRIAQPGDNPVSAGEVCCSGRNAIRPFGDPSTSGLKYALGEPRVGARLRGVEAVRENRPGTETRTQGLAVGGGVNAQG